MKKQVLLGLLVLGAFAVGEVSAADIKLGYVDVRSAIENTNAYHAGINRLEDMRKKQQKELNSLKDKILKAAEGLRAQSMIMSPERALEKQEELKSMNKLFERKQQDSQESLMREKNRLDQGILSDFYATVKNYAKTHSYDLILQKQPAVLHASDAFDITGDITKALDKKKK